MLSWQYRKSHCGDETILWSSHLHNGISFHGKMAFLNCKKPPALEPFAWISVGCNFCSWGATYRSYVLTFCSVWTWAGWKRTCGHAQQQRLCRAWACHLAHCTCLATVGDRESGPRGMCCGWRCCEGSGCCQIRVILASALSDSHLEVSSWNGINMACHHYLQEMCWESLGPPCSQTWEWRGMKKDMYLSASSAQRTIPYSCWEQRESPARKLGFRETLLSKLWAPIH